MTSGGVPEKNKRRNVAGFKEAYEKRFGDKKKGKGGFVPFKKGGKPGEKEDEDEKPGKKESVADRMKKMREKSKKK